MRKIEFHDREKETKEIRAILDNRPTLITFVYGPINSGKTEFINNLIKGIPETQKVFYINLRGRFISNYDEFIKVLFDVEHEARYGRIKEFLKPIVNVLPESYSGIPIPKDMFLTLFKEKDVEDAFVYIETVLRAFCEGGHAPVLVIDELQVIGDLKVDGLLIYKLFNFFIRLTKELHLAHVFAVTSDSLFIENVYSEAMLEGRCRYLLVDDFDEATTAAFLEGHGFTDDEKVLAWEYCGGKPVYLLELIRTDNRGREIERLLRMRAGELKTFLKTLKELGDKITVKEERYDISYENIICALKMFLDEEEIDMWSIDEISKHYLVRNNILFLDPDRGIIKPQSRLNLLAVREVMKDV
ncbi:MAG: ATP-binding protein [Candidatus Methanogaster sp.]|uniref:ATP-binding protein n=1 Tax=Candidatus Methanogaster sp. TaxID=3386292 RepID=A0AC61L1X7_9EURY|nr:MAG: ATP-binding protein [ANME-2 cluster archaeon]